MSELAAGVTPNPLTFDDRVDTDPNISSIEALGLIGRCMAFLGHVKLLFGLKFGFAIVAIFPGLVVPWLGKVIIDQVILQKPFGETEVRFPPFMNPFLDFVSGMTPLGIMASIVGLSAVMLLLFVREARPPASTCGEPRVTMPRLNLKPRSAMARVRWADSGACSSSCSAFA